MKRFSIHYNAPFTLTFSLICGIAYLLISLSNGVLGKDFFSIQPDLSLGHWLTWPRLLVHVFGHASIEHLSYNLIVILLIGPMLEEKYGTSRLCWMSALTALISGLLVLLLLPYGLMGASGIGFMLITLSSFTNAKRDSLPLTFVLVAIIFLGNELVRSFGEDNISQLAHIVGGACGGAFGYFMRR